MEHTVNRHVADAEQELWDNVVDYDRAHDHLEIPVGRIGAERTSVTLKRTTQIVATWANEGLVESESGKSCYLTEYGRQVDTIVEDRVTGESWRT